MRYFPIEDNSEIDIMIKIPLEVYKLYQCRFTGLGVSSRESPHYVKWVRYYLVLENKMKSLLLFILGAATILLLSYLTPRESAINSLVNGHGIPKQSVLTPEKENKKSTIYLIGYAGEEPVIDVYSFADNEEVAHQVIEGLNLINVRSGFGPRKYIVK